jgi:hypothetical protein
VKKITKTSPKKKELDTLRNDWRKKHRILKGRVILWPDKPPEHINARASKTYNWFWKNILLNLGQHDIPAIISNIKNQISNESDPKKIRVFRTMIGMAEDAYQLKTLEDIMDFDTEIQYEKKPVYNSEQGLIYKNGKIFTTDYSEDETEIIVRDIEGILVDRLSSGGNGSKDIEKTRNANYKNWDYIQKN